MIWLPADVFNFKSQSENKSLLNTIPTFPVYMMDLIVDWVNEQGGVAKMEQNSLAKSSKLYKAIDESSFYNNLISLHRTLLRYHKLYHTS